MIATTPGTITGSVAPPFLVLPCGEARHGGALELRGGAGGSARAGALAAALGSRSRGHRTAEPPDDLGQVGEIARPPNPGRLDAARDRIG